ncbi:6-phosphogluconolactonase [Patescibacteria group bacterium]|nr:6-phosphogluconolactonase [Patescibacteria group bacterium]
MDTVIKSTATEAAGYVANLIAEQIRQALESRPRASLVLAGGSTFKPVYRQLSEMTLPWSRLDLFFGDERNVPPDHEWSNYRMVRENWLSRYQAGEGPTVYRIAGELPAETAAKKYSEVLRNYGENKLPVYDVVLLGIGSDGHTASLFPNRLEEVIAKRVEVINVPAGQPPEVERITLTPLALSRSRLIVITATGGEKAEIVFQIQRYPEARYPINVIECSYGRKILVLDREAAGRL